VSFFSKAATLKNRPGKKGLFDLRAPVDVPQGFDIKVESQPWWSEEAFGGLSLNIDPATGTRPQLDEIRSDLVANSQVNKICKTDGANPPILLTCQIMSYPLSSFIASDEDNWTERTW